MKIKYHKSSKTFSFGPYKYLTLPEAKQEEEKYHICRKQLWEGEELVSW